MHERRHEVDAEKQPCGSCGSTTWAWLGISCGGSEQTPICSDCVYIQPYLPADISDSSSSGEEERS